MNKPNLRHCLVSLLATAAFSMSGPIAAAEEPPQVTAQAGANGAPSDAVSLDEQIAQDLEQATQILQRTRDRLRDGTCVPTGSGPRGPRQ